MDAISRPKQPGRGGSALYILLIVISVLFILGISVVSQSQHQGRLVRKVGGSQTVHYLAQAGLKMALLRLEDLFHEPLVRPENPQPGDTLEANRELLALLDIERAREWARVFEFDDLLVRGSTVRVTAELFEVTRNCFTSTLDRVEVIPPALEPYREKGRNDTSGAAPSPLGGWSGKLRLTAEAEYGNSRSVLQELRGLKIVDVTGCAPNHSLFIHGAGTEYLKAGRFVLSNLRLPDVVQEMLFELSQKINELLRLPLSEDKAAALENIAIINDELTNKIDGSDMSEALKLVFELAQHASDERIKDTVDNIILSLNPRDWGRVRTNGVLHVYLPFFAADDIINYFADTSIFGHQRPEIGYLYHDNRLHDPYLSVYTHFEGYIYKNYRRLNPLILGPSKEPQVVPPQRYTINTRMNYVKRYPQREAVDNLQRMLDCGESQAHRVFKKKLILEGTLDDPVELGGIWYCKGDVSIGGYYYGRGLIISEKNITISSSLLPLPGSDSSNLALVATKRSIVLGSPRHIDVKAGLYAHEGIRGTKYQELELSGNLAVETLNRPQMPRYFRCKFNSDLKSHMGDNIVGTLSKKIFTFGDLGGAFTLPSP